MTEDTTVVSATLNADGQPAKDQQELIEKEYPVWAKVLWRIFRGFISGFIVSFGLGLKLVSVDNIYTQEFWAMTVLTGALVGALQGLSKTLREFKPGDYKHLVHLLPF